VTSFSFTVGETDTNRLDKYLSKAIQDFSRTQIQHAIREGNALVNGRVQKVSFVLSGGEDVELSINPTDNEADSVVPENIPLSILFEDDFIIVINKPAGLVVHPGAGHPNGTLANGLAFHYKNLSKINGGLRPGIVHRLDKETSGAMVVAKTDPVHQNLGKQFEDRSVEKEYIGIAWGKWEGTGTIEKAIKRSRKDRTKYEVQDSGRTAKTDYKVSVSNKVMSIVHFFPKTGRTHQIRVHSEFEGHPIVGDVKYSGGKNRAKGFTPETQKKIDTLFKLVHRHLLHAKKLVFLHPDSGEKVFFEAPIPDDMIKVMETVNQLNGKEFIN
jgi:23S rRNA pseudouridine1911/1915/1917 synthase